MLPVGLIFLFCVYVMTLVFSSNLHLCPPPPSSGQTLRCWFYNFLVYKNLFVRSIDFPFMGSPPCMILDILRLVFLNYIIIIIIIDEKIIFVETRIISIILCKIKKYVINYYVCVYIGSISNEEYLKLGIRMYGSWWLESWIL